MKKLISLLIFIFLSVSVPAATIYVDANDGDAIFAVDKVYTGGVIIVYPNIQAAIDDANDGDTILVADGVYTGDGNRDIDFKGKAITVRSKNGPNNCIIDCNGTEAEPHRGFYFHGSEDANSVLDGFTITNGYAPMAEGGGIYCSQSSPTITNCNFSGNSASNRFDYAFGGGMCNWGGSPTVTNCTFGGNSASSSYDDVGGAFGGGMCNWGGSPTVTNCTFSGNSTSSIDGPAVGGGMCNGYGNSTITDCTFIGNSASSHGSGVGGGGMCNYDGSPKVTNCTFGGNSASSSSDYIPACGGGMFSIGDCSLTVTNCTFIGNSASGGAQGGGMCNWYGSPTIADCTFSGNSASGLYAHYASGGGMDNWYGSLTVTNCTFSGNSAEAYGGAIGNFYDSEAMVTNCILYDNRALYGNQVALMSASIVDVSYSDVKDGRAAVYDPCNLLIWGLGNIDVDPCFVAPGYWDANGTPEDVNDDLWVDGDYHLKSKGWSWDRDVNQWTWDDVTSRCIDAGNPGSPLGDEPLTLVVDPLNRWGKNLRIDMGAYGGTAEASMPPYDWALLADLTNDGVVNLEDFAGQAKNWLADENKQPGDLNRDGVVDIDDFVVFIMDWLGRTSWSE